MPDFLRWGDASTYYISLYILKKKTGQTGTSMEPFFVRLKEKVQPTTLLNLCENHFETCVICICGAPNSGKPENLQLPKDWHSSSMRPKSRTVSNKYYKWVCEEKNFNILAWSNDEFRLGEGIDRGKMHQSITLVLSCTPGNHLVVLEDQAFMEMADEPPLS